MDGKANELVTAALREEIRNAHWKATTCGGKVPEHSYITIYKCKEDAALVKKLIALIENHGYYAYFFRAKFKYFDVDDYRYWYYDDDLVNRTRNDPNNSVKLVEPENCPNRMEVREMKMQVDLKGGDADEKTVRGTE